MALLSAQRLDRRLEGSMGRREILLSGDLFGAFDKMPGVQYLPDVRSNGGRARQSRRWINSAITRFIQRGLSPSRVTVLRN